MQNSSDLSEIPLLNTHLPLEILIEIGCAHLDAWFTLLAIPDFARWTMSNQAQKKRHCFITKKLSRGVTRYFLRNKLHNFDDLPATIIDYVGHHWYQFDLLHRDNDLPAVYNFDGPSKWFKNGFLHRDNDKPAIVHIKGSKEWYQNGLCHRDNGPAVIHFDSSQEWWQNGKFIHK